MKGYHIQLSDVTMNDALHQIEVLQNIDGKQRNCLRLLTEELFSMMEQVLANREASFELIREGNEFSLGIVTRVRVSLDTKEELLSMSTDGKNLATKGLWGKISSLFEAMSYGAAMVPATDAGINLDCGGYSQMWRMSMYLDNLPAEDRLAAWDGMEKSIILNFADDVMVGVRDSQVEIVVKKKF